MSFDRVQRSACGKVILCGEHSVVYGRPAIALPVSHLRTQASIWANYPQPVDDVEADAMCIDIIAPDINARFKLHTRPQHPLSRIVQLTTEFVAQHPHPIAGIPQRATQPTLNCRYSLKVRSEIPVGSHLGSGAAASMACARAVAEYWGHELAPADASDLVYEIEKIHHGTPSGIDNTVIAYEQPVWFVKGEPPYVLSELDIDFERDLTLVIADTGLSAPTKMVVAAVRANWQKDPATYERYFDQIAALVKHAREALQHNDNHILGKLMAENHSILRRMGVSCLELDHLCITAQRAGAWGAKLSGGGRGGNMIALARDHHHARYLRRQLLLSGAKRVWIT